MALDCEIQLLVLRQQPAGNLAALFRQSFHFTVLLVRLQILEPGNDPLFV